MKTTALVSMITLTLKTNPLTYERLVNLTSRSSGTPSLNEIKKTTHRKIFFRSCCETSIDLLYIIIIFLKSKLSRQTTIHDLLLDLTRSKYDICVTCTWYLKCRCKFCIA